MTLTLLDGSKHEEDPWVVVTHCEYGHKVTHSMECNSLIDFSINLYFSKGKWIVSNTASELRDIKEWKCQPNRRLINQNQRRMSRNTLKLNCK